MWNQRQNSQWSKYSIFHYSETLHNPKWTWDLWELRGTVPYVIFLVCLSKTFIFLPLLAKDQSTCLLTFFYFSTLTCASKNASQNAIEREVKWGPNQTCWSFHSKSMTKFRKKYILTHILGFFHWAKISETTNMSTVSNGEKMCSFKMVFPLKAVAHVWVFMDRQVCLLGNFTFSHQCISTSWSWLTQEVEGCNLRLCTEKPTHHTAIFKNSQQHI